MKIDIFEFHDETLEKEYYYFQLYRITKSGKLLEDKNIQVGTVYNVHLDKIVRKKYDPEKLRFLKYKILHKLRLVNNKVIVKINSMDKTIIKAEIFLENDKKSLNEYINNFLTS
jgi:hypothetical protein